MWKRGEQGLKSYKGNYYIGPNLHDSPFYWTDCEQNG